LAYLRLPRMKVYKVDPRTKWEKFAEKRGISNKKRSRYVYDEEQGKEVARRAKKPNDGSYIVKELNGDTTAHKEMFKRNFTSTKFKMDRALINTEGGLTAANDKYAKVATNVKAKSLATKLTSDVQEKSFMKKLMKKVITDVDASAINVMEAKVGRDQFQTRKSYKNSRNRQSKR